MGNKFSMIDEPQFLFLPYLHSGPTILYDLEVLLAYLHSGPTLLYDTEVLLAYLHSGPTLLSDLEVLSGLLTFRIYSFI